MSPFAPDPKADLFTLSSGAFSIDDQEKIRIEADSRWKARMDAGLEAEQAWREVVVSFHRGSYWGYRRLSKQNIATKVRPTEEQVRNQTVRRFFWTAIQSLVIMKGVIMYFGLNYAMEREAFYGGANTSFYGWGLAVSVSISFGGLIWFAIKNSRARHWD